MSPIETTGIYLAITDNNNAAKLIAEKYNKNGKLTIDEFITLINLMLNGRYQAGRDSVMNSIKNGNPTHGWEVVRCMNCNKPMSGAIVDHKTEIGRKLLERPWTYDYCRAL